MLLMQEWWVISSRWEPLGLQLTDSPIESWTGRVVEGMKVKYIWRNHHLVVLAVQVSTLLTLHGYCWRATVDHVLLSRKWRKVGAGKSFKGSINLCFNTTYWAPCGCTCEKWICYLWNLPCNKLWQWLWYTSLFFFVLKLPDMIFKNYL